MSTIVNSLFIKLTFATLEDTTLQMVQWLYHFRQQTFTSEKVEFDFSIDTVNHAF